MSDQMNVLLIHADQMRYDALGCNGNQFAHTPNLDHLAEQGTVFTRHISANTICMPSRASLFTGLYPPGHGVWTNGVALNRREYIIHTEHQGRQTVRESPTMADVFADAGYATASFGKLHFTPNLAPPEYGYPESWELVNAGKFDDWHGPYYGFQYVETTQGHGEHPCHAGHYALWLQNEHPDVYALVVENQKNRQPTHPLNDVYPSPVPGELHHSAWLADRFNTYIEERDTAQPFFAFVGFPGPHHPFTPSFDVVKDFEDIPVHEIIDPLGEMAQDKPLFENGTDVTGLTMDERQKVLQYYYAMVHQIDRAVGKIIDGLQSTGLWEQTIVVFTSDHGDYMCDHGRLRKGETACEQLLHLPYLMRIPGVDLPKQVNTPMSNVDVLPTLAAAANVEIPSLLHGCDIVQVVNEGLSHTAMAYSSKDGPLSTNATLYTDHYRYTVYPARETCELYDHRVDVGECDNLVDQHPELVAELQRQVEENMLRHYTPIVGHVCAW